MSADVRLGSALKLLCERSPSREVRFASGPALAPSRNVRKLQFLAGHVTVKTSLHAGWAFLQKLIAHGDCWIGEDGLVKGDVGVRACVQ